MDLIADIHHTIDSDWVFTVLIVTITYSAIVKTCFNQEFVLFLKAFFSQKASNQILREKSSLNQFFYNLPIAVVVISLILNYGKLGISSFFISTFWVLLFFIFKYLLLFFLAFVFELYSYKLLAFHSFLYEKVVCIMLLPFLFFLFYSPVYQFQIGVIIYVLLIMAFVYKLIRTGYLSFFYSSFSKAHIIIYLCTLEILPMILLTKHIL